MIHRYLQSMLYERLYHENSNKNRIKFYPHASSGKVVYAPTANGKCDPTWIILRCDEEIVNYYSWFLAKKGVKLEGLLWGSHISLVRGEIPDIEKCTNWGYKDGETFGFSYGDLVTNGIHWWLEVESSELDEFRVSLGLTPHPKSGFHITLGKIRK